MLTSFRHTTRAWLILLLICSLAFGDDRKGQNKQAAAMSMMAAGMAFFSCAMLLAQAANAKDPQQKAMMTMMGAQQCAQGAQNAAAGKQNEDNAKKLTEPQKAPETKVAEQPRQQNQTQAPQEPNLLSQIEKAGPSDTVAQNNNQEDLVDAPQSNTPDFSLPSPGKKSESPNLGDEFLLPIEQKVSVPKSVETPDPGFKVKEEEKDSTTSPGGTFASLTAGKTSLGEELKKAGDGGEISGVIPDGSGPIKRTPSSEFFLGADVDTSGGISSAGSGDSSFESLMAQYMGGGAGAQSPGLGTSDVVFLPTSSDPNKPGSNIFQYASYRYRKAAYTDGMLQLKGSNERGLRASLLSR